MRHGCHEPLTIGCTLKQGLADKLKAGIAPVIDLESSLLTSPHNGGYLPLRDYLESTHLDFTLSSCGRSSSLAAFVLLSILLPDII